MLEALDALGLSVEADKVAKRAVVVGCGGRFPIEKDAKEEVKLFLGNAVTAMRPLTAAVVAAGGNATYVLDGVPRMRERPIGDLGVGLKQLGASVDCFLGTDCPPVRINGIGGLHWWQAVPEATLEALKAQIATLQGEKEQLIRQHQEDLSAQKTSYKELKEQAMQARLQHEQDLKDAKAAAEARLAEACPVKLGNTAR
ncbi:3-phosphoshikimate 1-carboxyvinyltransferase, chloroplastic-like [Lolium rigidum]|nr:3-phosphoshikimate 1-carboxyvinyltransferase, chloroplastic-like [Lolium rigidum]